MKYIKLFENFEDYDPYELVILSPNQKGEMIVEEIKKKDKANLNLVRDLIELGANLDWKYDYGRTALHVCASWNHPEIARMLIDAGADVNIQTNGGETALHWCVNRNSLEIARMLIDAGADLNMQDYGGWTALHWCTISLGNPTSLRIAKMLIEAGADKTITNNNRKFPYDLAKTQELRKLLKP